MPKKTRPPVIRSTRRDEYAHMSDADVTQAYLRMRDTHAALYLEMDSDAPQHAEHGAAWEMCDAQGLALDDELCARDMDLPGARLVHV